MRELFPWRKSSRLGCRKDSISDRVVAKDSVPITAATDLMVAKTVRSGMTDGAVRLVVKDGETKPVVETDTKLTVLKMKAKRT